MGADAQGVDPDPQLAGKTLAAVDPILALEIAEDEPALVGGHDVASRLRDFPAVEPYLAAVRTLQPGDQTQQRGFS